ncbi:NACHT domain-containing protein [Kitasatospora sp. NPDC005751]|uniref:NACHT domain-containing protein n=1 Tax=Kitasatospora sp. NPDC005751 TaxID=3157064 RepID=UPI00340DADF7
MTDSVHNRYEGSAQLVAQGKNIEISVIHPRDPVSDAADRLALRVGAQWQDEANVRGLTGPGRLAVRWEARWAPTADHTEVRPDRLGLDELIARLPGPARLVVTGPGGAGKSSLAVLLVLGMLERRGPGDAVPVVLSLSGWEPEKHSLDDWIVQRVTEDYGDLVPGSAAGIVEALVQSRKIVPLLDGLDELVPPARADVVVTALKRSRASTGSPLVLLSRPEAFKAAAAEESFLRAMPVLRACPVTPQDGRDYLARECDPERLARWQPVFAELLGNPGGPLARALSSPLMLWLASTVYARGAAGPEELLDSGRLPTRAHIEDHLLDGLVPAVFSRGPAPRHIPGGVRPWGEKRALGYLRFLASLLDRGRTQDIAWWQILAAPTRPVVWGAVVLVAVALVGTGAAYAAAALLSLGESSTRAPFTTAAEALAASAGLSTVATVVGAVTAKHLFPGQGERPRRPVRTGSRFLPALPAVTVVLAVAGSVTPSGAPAILAAFFLPVLADVLLTRPADSDTALRPRLLLDDERRIAPPER